MHRSGGDWPEQARRAVRVPGDRRYPGRVFDRIRSATAALTVRRSRAGGIYAGCRGDGADEAGGGSAERCEPQVKEGARDAGKVEESGGEERAVRPRQ
jgi:hypothetical protein